MADQFYAMADYFAQLTGLPSRFGAGWMGAENGYAWDSSTNNPANVSYFGQGVPSGGVYQGATHVLENHVVVYASPEDGVKGWADEINAPTKAHGGDKLLTVDTQDLKEALARGGILEACKVLGESNWAGSHYNDGKPGSYPGKLVWDAYNSTAVQEHYGAAQPSDPQQASQSPASAAPVQDTSAGEYTIQPGDTLDKISQASGVPVGVLARVNHLANPDLILAGHTLQIPRSVVVKPGDVLSRLFPHDWRAVARENRINPDIIRPGQVIYG